LTLESLKYKIQTQNKKNTTMHWWIRGLFFDGMSKERKIQRDKVQSVKEWNNTKKNKNTACIFWK